MLKKIFSTLCMAVMLLFIANSSAAAETKIAVVLDAPTGMFSEPEKVYSIVQQTLDKILKGADYEILPVSDTADYVQIYREENDLTSAVTPEGIAVENFLKKEDINKIGKHFGADYVIYTRVSSTAPKVSTGLFTASQKVNVILDFRVWSDSKQDFNYTKRATTTGSSTAIYAGIGSASRALEKGLKKGLQEVEKDAVKVRAAME
ncbi:MAG: hypothetical protein J5809_08575 [Selenomonadaceae bacterium]|nr:hypothetical protein [Selenomonadaceae bacterium]